MLVDFFSAVRAAGVPATIRELLDLINALDKRLVFASIEDFYHLSRLILVKDERHYDKFDRAFAAYFKGIESLDLSVDDLNIPEDWLNNALKRSFSDEEMAQVQAQGDLNELLEKFQQRLKEQQERHQGGNKWIGTGGTSPFGAFGFNPQGFRIGQGMSRHRRAIKVWEERHFQDLDDQRALDVRQFQVALQRLRIFARHGAEDILDLEATIAATAKNAGYLDLKMTRERHNAAKVLLLFDVGGSMDDHVAFCESLFTAARSEFKHLAHYYFHNCLYESVWQNNARRWQERIPTTDLLHRYGSDWRVIIVGDAMMSPFEIAYAGGSVEHMNEEPGAVWLKRLTDHFDHLVWLNPADQRYWPYTQSVAMIQQLIDNRMYPLTVAGIDEAMRSLT